MERIVETIVLILAIVMAAPLPFEKIVGDYGRLALAVLGFLLVFRWLFKNDQKKDRRAALPVASAPSSFNRPTRTILAGWLQSSPGGKSPKRGEVIGRVEAPDAEAAIRAAIAKWDIREPERQKRLSAHRIS
jgi:hypothetical protein